MDETKLTQMTDFKETKELLEFGVVLTEEIYNITLDADVSYFKLAKSGMSIFGPGKRALSGIRNISNEFKDATEEDVMNLKSWFAQKFNLEQEKTEATVELVLNTTIELVRNAYLLQKIKQGDSKSFDSLIDDTIKSLEDITI